MAGGEKRHVIESGAWSAWLDGELSEGGRARVEAHLAACPACREHVEAWREAQRQLASHAPPARAPGAAAIFWARIAPELTPAPQRRPDPALYLAPAALAAAWTLVQAIGWVWGVAGPLGGGRLLAAAWQWLAASGLLADVTGVLPGWRLAVPPGWEGSLWALAGSATAWATTVALAVLYAAWLVLWLRRPAAVASTSRGGGCL